MALTVEAGGEEHVAQLPSIQMHWTASRQGLVLSGAPGDIQSVARLLEMSSEATVKTLPNRATLAIWGDALSRFERTFHDKDESSATAIE